ncbi:MAG TPA: hypothetical protein VF384_03545 [Planctomycetota bacterium]
MDAFSGPGTNFTSIATAVATVPSGSVLIVRQGSYLPFVISGKSLKILGDPGVTVHPPSATPPSITIAGLTAAQSVVLKGLGIKQGYPTGSTGVVLSNCQGPILIENLQTLSGARGSIQATSCEQLLIRDHQLPDGWMPCRLINCNTVLENCRFGAGAILPGFIAGSGVTQQGGTLQVADCTIAGGVDLLGGLAHAIEMQGGDLRVLGATNLQPGFSAGTSFSIGGTGTVRLAPTAVLAAAAFAAGVTATTMGMPKLVTTFATPLAQARLDGQPGQLGAICLALPGPRVVVPGIQDAIWLDGATFVPLSVGVMAPGSPIVANMTWSSGPVPAVRAVWQAVSLDPALGLQISNPSLRILP